MPSGGEEHSLLTHLLRPDLPMEGHHCYPATLANLCGPSPLLPYLAHLPLTHVCTSAGAAFLLSAFRLALAPVIIPY